MDRSNKRPSPLTMANEKNYSREIYLRDLKQNYARRKDNIELIKSNNALSNEIRILSEQIMRDRGGQL